MPFVERDVMLRTIDWQWMEYLTQMEHFREGIGLRAYGQRDPLVEYKNEAFEMFNELRERIEASIVRGAYGRFSEADAADRTLAFAAYLAALDRERSASDAYADQIRLVLAA